MRERGLQCCSSNYADRQVTRDEGLKREVVRRQFHFPFVWYRLRAELVLETRAQDVDWSRSVPVTDARAHGL